MFLNPDELFELTGRKNPTQQMLTLSKMGIAYKVNALGKVIVLRSHLEQTWEGKRKVSEPDWSAVR